MQSDEDRFRNRASNGKPGESQLVGGQRSVPLLFEQTES